MANPTRNPTPQIESLEEVLAAYVQAVEAGQPPDRREWLRRHPKLAGELQAYFDNLDFLDQAAGPPSPKPPRAAETTTEPPRSFGEYELLEKIAEGGMGIVWKARQLRLNRLVALKMIRAGEFASSGELRRFQLEAENAAHLEHPHIVPLYEVGEYQGQPYFTMKLIEGGSLAQHLPRLAKDYRAMARLLATVARAVHYAHQRGILHRDLKPGNILLDAQGAPHVADFGLAKRLEGSAHVTQSGAVGTAGYIAPEQATGQRKRLTTAADVYGLGAIFYELLTGQRPFRADTPMETLLLTMEREPPRPRMLQPHIDRDLETICLKCLQKEPERRYASAEALAEDLERWLNGESIRARPAGKVERLWRWCWHNRLVASLTAAVFLLLAAVAGVASVGYMRARAAEQEIRRQWYAASISSMQQAWDTGQVSRLRALLAETESYPDRGFEWYYWQRLCHLERQTFIGHRAKVTAVSWSPDGKRVASASGDGTAKVWLAATGQELLTLRGHTGSVLCVSWSPDGTRLATASGDGTAKVWDGVSGRELLFLECQPSGIWSVCWSQDGKFLVTGGEDTTAKVWEAASGRELLTLNGHRNGVFSVSWSPDGKFLATGSWDGSAKIWDVWSVREPLTLNHGHWVRFVSWSSDGKFLATAGGDSKAKVWEAASGRKRLTLQGHTGDLWSVSWSPNGQELATASDDGTAKVWEVSGGRELLTFGHTGWVRSVTWSPDGKQLATGSGDRIVKVWEVADGRELLTLQDVMAEVGCVSWSPDGKRLVAASVGGTVKVWDAANGRELPTLKGHTRAVCSMSWSPDGQWLLTGSTDGTAKVWEIAGCRELLTLNGHANRVYSVAWSPDGQRLATAGPEETAKVWQAASGRPVVTLRGHTRGIRSVSWSPAGKLLATGSLDGTAKVWEAAGGRELLTLQGHTGDVWSVSWSPDGQRLATGSADRTVKVWEAAGGRQLLTLQSHTDGVRCVTWSPDGKRLAMGSVEGTAKVWEAAGTEAVQEWARQDRAREERLARNAFRGPHAEGFIQTWLLLLPVPFPSEESGGQALDRKLAGEPKLTPKPGQRVRVGDKELVWWEYRSPEAVLDFNAVMGQLTEGCVAYAICYLESDQPRDDLWLQVGSDDQGMVAINGRVVYQYRINRSLDGLDTIGPVVLEQGTNVLLFKVANADGQWQGCLRLVDEAGRPAEGIRVHLTPGP